MKFFLGFLCGLVAFCPLLWAASWSLTKIMEIIIPIPKPTIKTFIKVMAKDQQKGEEHG